MFKSSEKFEQIINDEIKVLSNEYKTNKNNCIETLVDAILDVQLDIPDVVLGQFAEKFK